MMMNEQITIEIAKIGDLSKIEYLLRDLIDTIDDFDKIGIKLAMDNCRRMIDDPNSHIPPARLKKNIAGFINFTTRKTILHNTPSGLIDELVVTKANRGKGIGKKLIKAAIRKCCGLGCCEIEVSAEKINEKARAFYKKCGFDEDAVLLEYDLDKKNG